jgi:integrase
VCSPLPRTGAESQPIPANAEAASTRGSRADRIWSENDIAELKAVAGLELALWTGQRQGDLLRLRRSDYDCKRIVLKQSKTGRSVSVPVSQSLAEMLSEARRQGPYILTTAAGRPWTSDGFRTSINSGAVATSVQKTALRQLPGMLLIISMGERMSE